MAKSQNGWYASPNLDRRDLVLRDIEIVGGIVDDADVAEVFNYLIRQYDKRVEKLYEPGCWGFYYRPNKNDPNSLSNHSSGTAIDINAPSHPNGVPAAKTFSKRQIDEIHNILAELNGVLRWGGDYTRTPDAMHFEINKDRVAVKIMAQRIRKRQNVATEDKVLEAIRLLSVQSADETTRLGKRIDRSQRAVGLALKAAQKDDKELSIKILEAVVNGDDRLLAELTDED